MARRSISAGCGISSIAMRAGFEGFLRAAVGVRGRWRRRRRFSRKPPRSRLARRFRRIRPARPQLLQRGPAPASCAGIQRSRGRVSENPARKMPSSLLVAEVQTQVDHLREAHVDGDLQGEIGDGVARVDAARRVSKRTGLPSESILRWMISGADPCELPRDRRLSTMTASRASVSG